MTVFVDTSALLAVLDAKEQNHVHAGITWERLITNDEELVCTNYVLVEAFALVQSRLGMEAARTLHEDIVPALRVEWLDAQDHDAGVKAMLIADRRQLSLVDCSSFETMRRLGISTAFTFDRHFAEQGFVCIP
jgi:predicted nucleic acid-binding protein